MAERELEEEKSAKSGDEVSELASAPTQIRPRALAWKRLTEQAPPLVIRRVIEVY